MSSTALDPPGSPVETADLVTAKARGVVSLIESGRFNYFRVVETRRTSGADVVVVDVEPEVPQHPAALIHRVERLACVLFDGDGAMPLTLSLRSDFPEVPHLNLVDALSWPSLCLFDEPYQELRGRWTAALYLRRIHEWLSLTSQGALHADDQALEPFLPPDVPEVVIPSDLFGDGQTDRETLVGYAVDDARPVYFVRRRSASSVSDSAPTIDALALLCEPQVHGIIRHRPRALDELHELAATAGRDLRGLLRDHLRSRRDDQAFEPGGGLLLLLFVPLLRASDGEIERTEVWAFMVAPVGEVGARLGLWEVSGGQLLPLIPPQDLPGADIEVELLRPVRGFSRGGAAALNGVEPDARRVVAIGAGALGSQVVANLVRSGFGRWDLVDDDVLMPHNTARHALTPTATGFSKVNALAVVLNAFFDDEEIARGVVENVLSGGAGVAQVVSDADLVLDFSASVPAARWIGIDGPGAARRMSLFLNPDGSDLVLLVEDSERQVRLDDLEMQYYRAVLTHSEFEHHLRPDGTRVRYGRSCRDVTSDMPQYRVGMYAGIGAGAVHDAARSNDASIRLWLANESGVNAHTISVKSPMVRDGGGWMVRTDAGVVAKLMSLRSDRLPNETGGVLVGHHDLQRRIIYVADALPSPPDSEEWPVAYIRGSKGLTRQLDEIQARTGNMVTYVGEWHSHPERHSTRPSSDDCLVGLWIAEHMDMEERPAFMAIVGDNGPEWYVAEVIQRSPTLAVRLLQASQTTPSGRNAPGPLANGEDE